MKLYYIRIYAAAVRLFAGLCAFGAIEAAQDPAFDAEEPASDAMAESQAMPKPEVSSDSPTNNPAILLQPPPVRLRIVSEEEDLALSKQPSPEARIDIRRNGAEGHGASHRIWFNDNLNDTEAVAITMANGRAIKAHAVALAVADDAGSRVWLGQLKDSQGEVLEGGTQVIYRDAFKGIRADVTIEYGLNFVEQNVVLRESFELPSEIDFSTARLEAWTEVFDGPEPRQKQRPMALRKDSGLASEHGRREVSDTELDFGLMRMVEGKAFEAPQKEENQVMLPVQKSWIQSEGRVFLVESVDFASVKPLLDGLAIKQAGNGTSRAHFGGSLPRKIAPGPARGEFLLAKESSMREPGIVLDYLLVNTCLLNINFAGTQGAAVAGVKSGPAAMGYMGDDFWNMCDAPYSYSNTVSNLKWHDGTASASNIKVTILNAPGTWGNNTGDRMYDNYSYSYSGNMDITVTNLTAGVYDVYLYGHGAIDNANGKYYMPGQGTKSTASGSFWNTPLTSWTENTHYVVFRSVTVPANGGIYVQAQAGLSGYTLVNGMQIACAGDSDNDGLPDSWEIQYFGNLNQTASGDSETIPDGINNLTEYRQGRNPKRGTLPDTGGVLNFSVHTLLK
jgi:hypothetical protein